MQDKDYESQLAKLNGFPMYSLGEEVMTKYGKGIIVYADMPYNGLYISPERAEFIVWFGINDRTRFVNRAFRINEISKVQPPPQYSGCENAGIINCLEGIDINCGYCGKEVEGLRKTVEQRDNFSDYFEVQPGNFVKK